MATTTFACQACGVEVVRPVVRGQRPKWCQEHRNTRARQRLALGITGERLNGPFPSSVVPPGHPSRKRLYAPGQSPGEVAAREKQRMSGLTYARDSGDRDGVLAFIRDRVTVSPLGCWEWNGKRTRDGYAQRQGLSIHRISAEAWLGDVPKGWQVHHICAVRHCVAPLHLQIVTPQANTAEMLHRRAYEARILALEGALREASPGHPLL